MSRFDSPSRFSCVVTRDPPARRSPRRATRSGPALRRLRTQAQRRGTVDPPGWIPPRRLARAMDGGAAGLRSLGATGFLRGVRLRGLRLAGLAAPGFARGARARQLAHAVHPHRQPPSRGLALRGARRGRERGHLAPRRGVEPGLGRARQLEGVGDAAVLLLALDLGAGRRVSGLGAGAAEKGPGPGAAGAPGTMPGAAGTAGGRVGRRHLQRAACAGRGGDGAHGGVRVCRAPGSASARPTCSPPPVARRCSACSSTASSNCRCSSAPSTIIPTSIPSGELCRSPITSSAVCPQLTAQDSRLRPSSRA